MGIYAFHHYCVWDMENNDPWVVNLSIFTTFQGWD